jgi:hypothetical protein
MCTEIVLRNHLSIASNHCGNIAFDVPHFDQHLHWFGRRSVQKCPLLASKERAITKRWSSVESSGCCTILRTCRRIVRRKACLVPGRAAHQRRIEDVAEMAISRYAILPHRYAGIGLKVTRQQCRSVGRYRNVLPESGSDASSPPLSRKPKPRLRFQISAKEDLRHIPRLRCPW